MLGWVLVEMRCWVRIVKHDLLVEVIEVEVEVQSRAWSALRHQQVGRLIRFCRA